MQTKIVLPDNLTLAECARIIKEGGLVAFPTETVYGLGADATSDIAVQSVFRAKGRPSDNPLIVHIADKEDINKIAQKVTSCGQKLIDAFMPGAITLVFKKNPVICESVSSGLDTVGIRLPANETARAFIRACKVPIAAPSANTSSRPSPTEAMHVYEDLKDKIPAIIDGGSCEIGIESTVADVTGEIPVILRPGKITREDIARVCGDCLVSDSTDGKVRSPGVKYRHYAPKCDCVLAENGNGKLISALISQYSGEGKKAVALCFNDTAKELLGGRVILLGENNEQAASRLYSSLRIAEKEADIIIIESAMAGGIGVSLMNRMKKSAGGNIITSL